MCLKYQIVSVVLSDLFGRLGLVVLMSRTPFPMMQSVVLQRTDCIIFYYSFIFLCVSMRPGPNWSHISAADSLLESSDRMFPGNLQETSRKLLGNNLQQFVSRNLIQVEPIRRRCSLQEKKKTGSRSACWGRRRALDQTWDQQTGFTLITEVFVPPVVFLLSERCCSVVVSTRPSVRMELVLFEAQSCSND